MLILITKPVGPNKEVLIFEWDQKQDKPVSWLITKNSKFDPYLVPPFATFSDSSADRFHRWDQACRFYEMCSSLLHLACYVFTTKLATELQFDLKCAILWFQLLVGVLCFLILSEAPSETCNLDHSVQFGRMLIMLQLSVCRLAALATSSQL